MSAGAERRRHVRVKPSPELPIRVALAGTGPFREALDVVDLSVAGFSLASPALRSLNVGETLKLFVSLGQTSDELAVNAVSRWTKGDGMGVELVDPPPSAAKAISKYVSELLERGV